MKNNKINKSKIILASLIIILLGTSQKILENNKYRFNKNQTLISEKSKILAGPVYKTIEELENHKKEDFKSAAIFFTKMENPEREEPRIGDFINIASKVDKSFLGYRTYYVLKGLDLVKIKK